MKLNTKKIIYVAFAFLLISTFWQAYDNLIAKILINKFGLDQLWSGIVMALDNIFALFMLPLFGLLSDKTKSRWGRRTPYIFVGTIIAVIAFIGIGFIDHSQTNYIKNNTDVITEYDNFLDKDDTLVETWVLIYESMDNSKEKELIGDILDNDEYQSYDEETKLNIADRFTFKDRYNTYLSKKVWDKTKTDLKTFILFMIVLLIALLAMSTFRSPAVALMPDVTIKPLRSQANAIINLMGAVGGVIFLIISTILGIGEHSYDSYLLGFVSVAIIMTISLIIFLLKVKEIELVKIKESDDEKYGVLELEEKLDKKALADHKNFNVDKDKRKSLLLILFSVLFWFMGYNAIISKLSDYAPTMLNMGFATILLIANVTAIISFIPIGIVSAKIGRKKVILFGVALLTICFGSVFFITPETNVLMYAVLGLTGIAWASINVNSYPMVVELSKGDEVGKYTGYYYAFSMAAQIITPILSGFLMTNSSFGRRILFPYAALMALIAFIIFSFVKHGDIKAESKQSLLEHFDVED